MRELRIHSAPTVAERVRTGVEIVAIVAAGLWALYTFIYEQRIKPLLEQPSFSVPTSVEQSRAANGVVFLKIRKQLQNTGDVAIDVAAEALDVYGEQVVKKSQSASAVDSPTHTEVRADVQRRPVKLLYAFARLRNGALGGDQRIAFYVPPHSSNYEDFLVAVPANAYPVILVTRKDYVGKAPISPKIAVKIVRAALGGYDLQSASTFGEYDSQTEYPIR